jgi:hypothetical protein
MQNDGVGHEIVWRSTNRFDPEAAFDGTGAATADQLPLDNWSIKPPEPPAVSSYRPTAAQLPGAGHEMPLSVASLFTESEGSGAWLAVHIPPLYVSMSPPAPAVVL